MHSCIAYVELAQARPQNSREPILKETPETWTSTLRQAHNNMMQDHTLHCVVHASDQKISLQTRYFTILKL